MEALRAQPQLIKNHGDERDEHAQGEQRMIRRELGHLAHGLLRSWRPEIIAALAAALLAGPRAAAQSDEERALDAVREEIRAVEVRLSRETTERDTELKNLRRAELAVAAASEELTRIRTDLRAQRARREALSRESAEATRRLAREREALAGQVRLSYVTGREELFKLLLSQESPASLGRMLVYYDYFNRARTARIEAAARELARLETLAAETGRVEQELEELARAQAREVEAQETARAERRAALERIETSMADAGGRIGALRLEEERLSDLVLELAEILEDLPRGAEEPFASRKGSLPWPLDGRVAENYGQPRDGGPLRWNGVLLSAATGTDVQAVYHGRVAFADWLPGLGLLVIVDHGGGYMSLYGHNEALLKESGEWVSPGDALAQVGDSGGQAEPGLYFEIRHNGEPVDPRQWLRRGTSGR
jgi:septal ring factor EnvC (AmiA/AmiB activator)